MELELKFLEGWGVQTKKTSMEGGVTTQWGKGVERTTKQCKEGLDKALELLLCNN